MPFYLYLLFSIFIGLVLLVFDITFGIALIKGAPFSVTKSGNADRMIRLIKEAVGDKKNIRVLDLGSGDGRLVRKLAETGFSADGIEINPFLAWWSRRSLSRAGLFDKAHIRRGDFWREDFSGYDVIIVFGVFYIMERLEKKLKSELKPGSFVASNHFVFTGLKPVRQEGDVYLYIL